jgi:hypothetical protein
MSAYSGRKEEKGTSTALFLQAEFKSDSKIRVSNLAYIDLCLPTHWAAAVHPQRLKGYHC